LVSRLLLEVLRRDLCTVGCELCLTRARTSSASLKTSCLSASRRGPSAPPTPTSLHVRQPAGLCRHGGLPVLDLMALLPISSTTPGQPTGLQRTSGDWLSAHSRRAAALSSHGAPRWSPPSSTFSVSSASSVSILLLRDVRIQAPNALHLDFNLRLERADLLLLREHHCLVVRDGRVLRLRRIPEVLRHLVSQLLRDASKANLLTPLRVMC